MKKILCLVVFVLLIAIVASGCAGSMVRPASSEPESVSTEIETPNTPAPTFTPIPTDTPQNTPTVDSLQAPQGNVGSLNYDETNSDSLTPGQTELVAVMIRALEMPVNQEDLEALILKSDNEGNFVSGIQLMAANASAEVYQGENLVLDDYSAWFVWTPGGCPDKPSDVTDILNGNYADGTLGQIWIQVPFAEKIPARGDNTWNCPAWAVRVH